MRQVIQSEPPYEAILMNSKFLIVFCWLLTGMVSAADPVTELPSGMKTRWATQVDPQAPLPEYPRPRLVREQWLNLNGLWDYAIRPLEFTERIETDKWDGQIVVPFCPESILSRVNKRVSHTDIIRYRRTFTIPAEWNPQDRILLHFGAVDWHTTVHVNGKEVGEHTGGYDPFSFDITTDLHADRTQPNTIQVRVSDPTDHGAQPRGKQIHNPHGIWYTPVTGIWQTVWLEPVPQTYIKNVQVTANIERARFDVQLETGGNEWKNYTWRTSCRFEERNEGMVAVGASEATTSRAQDTLSLSLGQNNLRSLWTPDSPKLFDIVVEIKDGDTVIDRVTTYSALRKIHFQKDERGHNRLYLNNKPLFQYGPLDQGWWPDGLYTAPTDEALKYDIEVTKELGFNMARKHVKVEPERWYYWCDKLGLLVWQDMPSGMASSQRQAIPPDAQVDASFSPEEDAQFRAELKAMIDARRNHPCIVVWVPFNEGWGQHNTNEILKWVKEYDPTRLVGGPSGWTDRGYGDLKDMHNYPGPGMFPVMEDRVSVLGEFGGLGLPLEGHTLLAKDNWGYRTYATTEELQSSYARLLQQMPGLIADGLSAAVYTQTTDVEIEVNGLMTYDREVIKFDAKALQELHAPLYGPVMKKTVLVPTSEREPQQWTYTTEQPGRSWAQPEFDVSKWKTGPGGLGTEGTPNTQVRTIWDTSDVWARREFEIKQLLLSGQVLLRIYHDEDAEVYLNGTRIGEVKGYVTSYVEIPLSEEARQALKAGKNVLAVHCHQTGGGQFIDVGLSVLAP
jgi:hypothetical protein